MLRKPSIRSLLVLFATVTAGQLSIATSAHAQRKIVVDNRTESKVVPMTGVDEFMPPLTRGDREFDGNGPEIKVYGELFVRNNAVYRRIFMSARETTAVSNVLNPSGGLGASQSAAEGYSKPKLVYRGPAGKTITDVLPKKMVLAAYEDSDFISPSSFHKEHLKSISVRGDRRGDDIGFYTGVRVEWDTRITVVMKKSPNFPLVQRVDLPRQLIVRVNRLEKGDREFNGNGPRVSLQPYIGASHNRLWIAARMDAKETKSDWSTGYGVEWNTFYEVPAGFRIKRVTDPHGRVISGNVKLKRIEYTDNDHDGDVFTHDKLGRVIIIGDSKGKDINRMTRAEFRNINYYLNVHLEGLTK